MSKTKSKTHNEAEHLRGIIREQKSIIRNLKKRLKELERREHYYENKHLYKESDKQEKDNTGDCPSCGKGNLMHKDLFIITIWECDHCGHTEKEKKKEIPPKSD